MRRQFLSAAAVAALLAACSARDVSDEQASGGTEASCVRCHGGDENQTGAPPRTVSGLTATTEVKVGAHSAHVEGLSRRAPPLGCEACHVAPDAANPGTHIDGRTELHFGLLASAGGVTPTWDPSASAGATCTNYCHGASLAGGANRSPVWNGSEGAQADCGACHGKPPPSPHPQRTDCARCHPDSLDLDNDELAGGSSPATATLNHLNGQVDLAGGCATCHGNPDRAATVELTKAAPPAGVNGETATTARAVGAHEAHLLGGDLALPVPCESCHVVPTEQAHSDGAVQLRFAGVAVAQGAVATFDDETDPANPTCTSWCHGFAFAQKSVAAPVWTRVDGTQYACGACHGAPPTTLRSGEAHPTGTDCGICHPGTVDRATGAIRVSNGMHVNGVVEVDDFHPAGWLTAPSGPDDPDWHGYAANRDLAGCKACHGDDFSGGATGVSCNACHAASDHAGWKSECTFCHGNENRAAFRPAPPVGTQGEVVTSTRAVGAHERHLSGGSYRGAMACNECHAVPSDLGHVNGTVDMTFGPLAAADGATPAIGVDGRCSSTYCHGATLRLGGGNNETPLWTGGAAEAVCSTCHGLPPPAPHPQSSQCVTCHDETLNSDGSIDLVAGKHVDGIVQALHYHPEGWRDPAQHGLAANRDLSGCGMCHGADLQGGPVGIGCASCHGQGWQSNCTFCHGEKLASYTPADLVRAAPPQGTQNEEAASARAVGAHQSHVRAGTVAPAFGCDECHPLPTDLSHVNGDAVAVNMAFGALANHGGFVSTFATGPATCTTYCHSALDRGAVETPAWATVDGSPGACGACHGLPPAFLRGGGHHMANPNCGGCHGAGYSATTVATATHVNGNVELEDMTCSSCHGDGNRTGNALLKAAPPVGTAGQTATTERGVGAHQKHVASTLASPVPCAECHDVPDPSVPASLAHSDGQVLVLFGPLATGSGAVPVWNPGVATCSSTYCHGNYRGTYTYTRWDWGNDVPETVTYDYVGSAATPTWTASAACGSCHGAPPVGGSWHGNHGGYNTCETCHPDAQGRPGSAVITNATLHVNGQVDVYAPKTSRCFGCH